MSENIQQSVIDFALAQVGKKYDYAGITGFLVRKDIQKAERWFCSELVAAAFESAGAMLLRQPPHKIDPGTLRSSPLLGLYALVYTPCRTKLPGDGLRVGIYKGSSPCSRAIRFRTWSEFSHASLILPDNSVIEAMPYRGVVHHADISEFHNRDTIVQIHEVNWAAIEAVRDFPYPIRLNAQDAPGSIAESTLTDPRPAAASHFAQGFRRFAQGIRAGMPTREYATP
jgi:hypothetical protein